MPDFIIKQTHTFFKKLLPSKEERLKRLYAEVKRNNMKEVSISSRHLHSSVSSSKVIFALEDCLPA